MEKKRPCIMVVDDEQVILTLLDRTLEPEGYGVIAAENGKKALQMLEKHKPDLVILDILMPDIDGLEVLNRIRQTSSVPVIMLTGIGEVATLHSALLLGADDYIRKPFSSKELLARIRAKLRRSQPELLCPKM